MSERVISSWGWLTHEGAKGHGNGDEAVVEGGACCGKGYHGHLAGEGQQCRWQLSVWDEGGIVLFSGTLFL
jgi:hypothetical protein